MKNTNQIKGIIFDMDNTLLQSRIDFAAMKRDIYRFLNGLKVLPDEFPIDEHTSSTIIEYARNVGISDEVYAVLMEIAGSHELKGMEGAGLEPGVHELLKVLYGKYVLVVITNNSLTAAHKALETTNIIGYFDSIVGRERMSSLKPSPSGFNYAKEQFAHISTNEWISIGDSWIDGKASMDAGVAFISYNKSKEHMLSKGVEPIGQINHIMEILSFVN